jgi:hypothetical protein
MLGVPSGSIMENDGCFLPIEAHGLKVISIAELGGITNLPDRDPTGRSSLNMCALTDADGTLLHNPEFSEILHAAQEDIRR